MSLTGTVFNLQRYCLHDGPGIRTTVFLKGCPAHCWWCHNPESQSELPEIACSQDRCISCDACLLACHDDAGPREACTLCGACADACPTGARDMVGRAMTAGEVMAALLKDRMFFEESGGGVTFSGGEPLCQPAFLRELLKECRRHEIHSAIDTAGLCATETLAEIAPLADLFLFDLKCADGARHLEGTGVGNGIVLDNLRRLSQLGARIWIRIPVIPGFNDNRQEMEKMARLAAGTAGVRQVWLLPYHGNWAAKPARFGKGAGPKANPAPPSPELLHDLAGIFTGLGMETRIGGAER